MPALTDALQHLIRLTDDTGIAEHACGIVPRRAEGYSTDDQARALWACMEWLNLAEDGERGMLLHLIDKYLAFLLWAQQEDGHYHNNYAYDRSREAETPSDDCLGRCIWACALVIARLEHRERNIAARTMLDRAWRLIPTMKSPRGRAYALAALSLLAERDDIPDAMPMLSELADGLTAQYRQYAQRDWRWFEPVIAYSNGVLPWGLLLACEASPNPEWLSVGLESLDFLIDIMTSDQGRIRPVGNQGWCTADSRAMWDQQPIDAMKLFLAASQAYAVTRQDRYRETAMRCRAWFEGDNDAGEPLVDRVSGGCRDGIGPGGASLNQGAESTISWLLTEAVYLQQFAQG